MQLNDASTLFLSGYFSTHDRSQKTKTAYTSDLLQFQTFAGADHSLLSFGSSMIEQWAAHLKEEGYSPASMRRKMAILKVFCAYWVRKGVLAESPFWRVKLSFGRIEQLPRSLTKNEMRKLLAQARRSYPPTDVQESGELSAGTSSGQASSHTYRALRNLALVDLLFATGMRVGEASSLDLRDYIFREKVFRVQGKGGRDRLAFIVDDETLQIQREHLAARGRIKTKSPALFLNVAGERLSTQGIRNVVAVLRQEGGLARHVTPHMLRHTVATLLLRNEVDIRVVQEFLGHASIATTQRYTHVAKEHLIGVLRKRHPSLDLRRAKQAGKR
jgi:integrase/recombinase XerD